MEKKFLLGVIKNQIVIGEFEIKDWNGYLEFSAHFSVGEAFDINLSESEIADWWEEYWYCLDEKGKLDALQDGERTKQDWIDEQVENTYYQDIKDCSCTDLEMDYNGVTINFETVSCGQHDVREDEFFNEMKFTNKEAFDKLMNLWDNYHLKEIDDNVKNEIDEIEELLQPYDFDCTWDSDNKVEDFIKDNLEF